MEVQSWDDRGRLTVRPEYRERLGNPRFLQVLTPSGLLFVPIPDKPSLDGLGNALDDVDGAERQAAKEAMEKHDRLRRRQPRSRRR